MVYTNEQRVLLLALHPIPGIEENIELGKLVSSNLDWQQITDSAIWHGVAQIVYKNLLAFLNQDTVPYEILEELKKLYQKNRIRNTIVLNEVEQVYHSLNDSLIPAIPLKGAFLTPNVYRDVGLRPMSDVDLLIKKSDLDEINTILLSLGYQLNEPDLYDHQIKNHYHIQYFNLKRKILIELHWGVWASHHSHFFNSNDFRLVDNFWARAIKYRNDLDSIKVLHPNDLLIMLLLHFIQHRFVGHNEKGFRNKGTLLQLCDIVRAIRYYDEKINTAQFMREVEHLGLTKVIVASLCIVQQIFQEWPTPGFNTTWNMNPTTEDKEFIEIIIKNMFVRVEPFGNIPKSILNLRYEDSFLKILKKLFFEVFPPPDILSKKLNKEINYRLISIHYITRPFKLLSKFINLLLKPFRLNDEIKLRNWIKLG